MAKIDSSKVSLYADMDLFDTCALLCDLLGSLNEVWRVNVTGAPVKQVKDKHQPITDDHICKRLLQSKHWLKLQ